MYLFLGLKHLSFKKGKSTAVAGMTDFFNSQPIDDGTVLPSTSDAPISQISSLNDMVGVSKDVLDAEITWCLKVVTSHYSYKSNSDMGKIFLRMFPDSVIARQLSCSERKLAYLCHFGLAPHFQSLMYEELKSISHFTILFDETLNKTNQKKQLDLHIRYWHPVENIVVTRYLTSDFMGHSTASDILESFQKAVGKLDLKKLLQISMDGPAVNWSFYDTLQSELKKEYNIECVSVGSCGLHILNNAFRKGAQITGWNISAILGALYFLFKDNPARREDFLASSKHKKFPLKFCNSRWLENAPVCQRAYDIWEDVKEYIKFVESGKCNKIKCKSYEILRDAVKDNLTPIKFLFFICVAEIIKPFMEIYQSDEPLIPFFALDIHKVVKQLLQFFKILKESYSSKITSSLNYLCGFDFSKSKYHSEISKVSLGFRGDKLLQEFFTHKKVTDRDNLAIKRDCQLFISSLLEKLMEKCPINYSIIRNAVCLDPKYMVSNGEKAHSHMKNLLINLSQKGQIHDEECDNILLEFSDFLENIVQKSVPEFKNYDIKKIRLDTFLYQFINEKYSNLWKIFKMILVLSHGQASVERGFSINKNLEVENLSENSYIAQRIVCDYVKHAGGVTATKELRMAASSAHAKYKLYLEDQRKEQEILENKKRKAKSDEQTLKEQKIVLEKEIKETENKANKLAQKAEKTKNFELLNKSNNLLKTVCVKQAQLREIDATINNKKLKKQ